MNDGASAKLEDVDNTCNLILPDPRWDWKGEMRNKKLLQPRSNFEHILADRTVSLGTCSSNQFLYL